MKRTLVALAVLAFSGCTYGKITSNGIPLNQVSVAFHDCSETRVTQTDSNGLYSLNPFSKTGAYVDSSKHVSSGMKYLSINRPVGGGLSYALYFAPVNITHEQTCFADPDNQSTSATVPCQEVSVDVASQSAAQRRIHKASFWSRCRTLTVEPGKPEQPEPKTDGVALPTRRWTVVGGEKPEQADDEPKTDGTVELP